MLAAVKIRHSNLVHNKNKLIKLTRF